MSFTENLKSNPPLIAVRIGAGDLLDLVKKLPSYGFPVR